MNLWLDRTWHPMLLKTRQKPFNDNNYLYEIKYDGTRAIIFASNNSVTIINRHGKDITHLYPELQKIKELIKRNTIFDGEIVLFKDNVPSFSKLQERAHLKDINKIKKQAENNPVVFVCFDILFDNKNLIKIPLQKRKEMLGVYKENDVFVKSFYKLNDGINLFKKINKLGLEGIVAKRLDSLYLVNKRTDYWLKIKNLKEQEFFVGGYIVNKDKVSFLLGEYKNDKLYYVGKVSTIKNNDIAKDVLKLSKLKVSLFCDYKENDCVFIRPIFKVMVKYLERTENNHLRQPVLVE